MIKIGIECENIEDSKSRWGVGQITLNLLKEYVKNPEWQNKFELYLYFKKRVPDGDLFTIHKSKFKIRILGFPSFNIFYHILMPLRAMADRLDWMIFPAYMLPPLYLGKSLVLLTGDVYYEYKHGNLPFRYRLAYGLFTNWAAIKAKKILAISETSKKEIAQLYGIDLQKIFVSYLGVENPKFQILNSKQNPKIQNSKSETVLNLKNSNLDMVSDLDIRNSNFLLFVGQMFPRRHAKETILAFKEIAGGHSDLKLIMVGKDKYSSPTIDSLIKEINNKLGGERIIHYDYLEKREDIDKLYAGARALIYISDREAFGLPPMEALSFGVPPIVMDNGLGHELFGDYGIYSKSGSVEDIENAMREALNNEQKTANIRTNGPLYVEKYSWKKFAEKLLVEIK